MDKEILKMIGVIFIIGGIVGVAFCRLECIALIILGLLSLLLKPQKHSKYYNKITSDKELNKWIDKLALLIDKLEKPYITVSNNLKEGLPEMFAGQYSSCMPNFLYLLLEQLKKDNYYKNQITDLSLYNLIIDCGNSIIDSEENSDYKDLICLIVIDCLKWLTSEGYIKSSDFNDKKTKILEKCKTNN